MTYSVSTLFKAAIATENRSNYGTNLSGSVSYNDAPFITCDITDTHEKHSVDAGQQRMDSMESRVNGRNRPTVAASMYLVGAPQPLSESGTPQTSPVMTMISTIMGGQWATSGALVVSAGSGSLSVASGKGANFKPGQIVGAKDSNGVLQVTQVRTVSSDALTFAWPLPFSVASGSTLFSSHTAYLTQDPTGSLQIERIGASTSAVDIATGLQGNFTLATPLDAIPTVDFALEGAAHFTGSNTVLTEQDYNITPPHSVDSQVLFAPVNPASPPSAFVTSECSITPAIQYSNVEGYGGVNNIMAKRRTRSVPVATFSLSGYFTDRTYWEARRDGDRYFLCLRLGSSEGRTVVILLPNVELDAEWGTMDSGDLLGESIAGSAHEPSSNTAATGYEDLAKSAMIIAIL